MKKRWWTLLFFIGVAVMIIIGIILFDYINTKDGRIIEIENDILLVTKAPLNPNPETDYVEYYLKIQNDTNFLDGIRRLEDLQVGQTIKFKGSYDKTNYYYVVDEIRLIKQP
ncbi:hypothetical protein UACE39S_05560 [Ureibacillus acetophenoni]